MTRDKVAYEREGDGWPGVLALARLRVGWLRRALALTRPRSTG
jgi:hypothetical protein